MLLRQLFENAGSKTAVLGWGRGMGHKGHMLLAKAVLHHAQENSAKPFFVVSRTSLVDPSTGQPWADKPTFTKTKDDPLTPEEKLATYRKVFPQNAEVFSVATADASTLDKVLAKIAGEGFKKVILIVGEDQKASMGFLSRPDKSGIPPYKQAGLDELEIISRQDTTEPSSMRGSPEYQEGPRATPMRQVLLDPSKSEEEQFAIWRRDMPDNLSDEEVMDLMRKAKQRMSQVPQSKSKTKENDNMAGGDFSKKPGLGFQTYATQTHAPRGARLSEEMLPKSAFAGTEEPWGHQLGPAAQANGKQKGPVKRGQLVGGGAQESVDPDLEENLRKWFKEKWVRFGPDGKIRGDCARGDDSEGKPKCLPQSKAHALGKKGRASAAARKRREDPNPERKGSAINVATKKNENSVNESVVPAELVRRIQHLLNTKYGANLDVDGKLGPLTLKSIKQFLPARAKSPAPDPDKTTKVQGAKSKVDELKCWPGYTRVRGVPAGAPGSCKKKTNEETCPHCGGPMFSEALVNEKKDACYYKVRSRYKVWPSAYASGALVQCRKKGSKNWGSKNESSDLKEVTAQDIANLNNIKNLNLIQTGQTLQLPDGTTYTVATGDTLSNIAAGKYKGTPPSADSGTQLKTTVSTPVKPFAVEPVKVGHSTSSIQISGDSDIMDMIKQHEGVRNRPYKDSKGLWTVGIGHLIGDGRTLPPEWNREFSDKEIMDLFQKDYQHHKAAATKIPGFNNLNTNGRAALIDLTFNMGPTWWESWPGFTKAMQSGNIAQAANELINSRWYNQVGRRAPKIVSLLRTGGDNRTVAENSKKTIKEVTAQDIANLNNIKNINLIKIGQQLTLPDGTIYTVKAGDNLTKIAARSGGTATPGPQSSIRPGLNTNISQDTRQRAADFAKTNEPQQPELPTTTIPAAATAVKTYPDKKSAPDQILSFGDRTGSKQNFDALQDSFQEKVEAAAAEYFAKTGKKLKITSAWRDPKDQERLYQQTIALGTPGIGPQGMAVAKPGTSKHEKGLAVDIQQYNDPAAVAAMNRQGLQQKVAGDPVHFTLEENQRLSKLVAISENAEKIMAQLIDKIIINEAIQSNKPRS